MTDTRSATRARMIVRVVIGLALLAMAAFEAIRALPAILIAALGVVAVAHGSRGLHRMEQP